MKWLLRILVVLVLLVGLAGAGAYYYYRQVMYGALPQTTGVLQVSGLQAPVEVIRDEWGIPHLYAENHHDLLFAQGYVQAQDRWWQMDFYRRIVTGRLGELAGDSPDARKVDVLMRTLNLTAVAQRDFDSLEPDLQQYYVAFCNGVNAYVNSRKPSRLAMEYALLGLQGKQPEVAAWTPADCLAFGKLMGYTFSGRDLEREPLQALLHKTLSAIEWWHWEPAYPYAEHPTTVLEEDLPKSIRDFFASLKDDATAPPSPAPEVAPAVEIPEPTSLLDGLPQGMPGVADINASNAWAVAGTRTESGKPLFASDPHQGIEIPNLWYEIGLHCPPDQGRDALNLYGYSAPMLPFVQAGNNDHICWGLTNVSGSDALDLFELRINPDNPLQYEWDGKWRDMETREEVIAVDGMDDIALTIRISHLGPLMPEALLPEGSKDKHWAIRWEGLKRGTIQRAGVALVFARNFEEFREALRHWDYPAANIAYADVEGNIGFQQAGRFPYGAARGAIHGPMPGYRSEHEWEGFVPFHLLPRVLNPASGLVVAANQPAVPEQYARYLQQRLEASAPVDTAPYPIMGYRARRIVDLLDQTVKHGVDSFARIQFDATTPELSSALHTLFSRVSLPESEARALLQDWDGAFDTNMPAALLAGLVVERLCANIFADEVGPTVDLSPDMVTVRRLELLAMAPDTAPFWDDTTTEAVETAADIVARSLEEAWSEAKENFGDDPQDWQWGQMHQAAFRNAFLGKSGIGAIEDLVNRTGNPAPGAFATVNAARYKRNGNIYEMRTLPAYRRIVDLSDFGNSMAVNSTGQSGHPTSPHYDDQLPLWLAGEYRPVLWTREQVEAGAKDRLMLQP